VTPSWPRSLNRSPRRWVWRLPSPICPGHCDYILCHVIRLQLMKLSRILPMYANIRLMIYNVIATTIPPMMA
jgi:hypothetical protein